MGRAFGPASRGTTRGRLGRGSRMTRARPEPARQDAERLAPARMPSGPCRETGRSDVATGRAYWGSSGSSGTRTGGDPPSFRCARIRGTSPSVISTWRGFEPS